MKLINSSYKIVEQEPGIQGVYKAIEQAGRTCYKSEDKITDTSAEEFVNRMINSKHYAMLEFGTLYLKCPIELYYVEYETIEETANDLSEYLYNPYSIGREVWNDDNSRKGYCYVTTNLRVLVENDWLDDLKYICEPTEFHEKRVCVKFTMDRIGSQSICRHRPFSFAQESTRYCNYSKDKFGNELTFIIPSWVHNLKESTLEEIIKVYGNDYTEEECTKLNRYYSPDNYENDFIIYLLDCESLYKDLVKKWDNKIKDNRYKTSFRNNPLTPQEARAVLPNCLKTEINMCGFISDWKHVFELRDNSHAHPDMQVLMKPLHEEFKKKFNIK